MSEVEIANLDGGLTLQIRYIDDILVAEAPDVGQLASKLAEAKHAADVMRTYFVSLPVEARETYKPKIRAHRADDARAR